MTAFSPTSLGRVCPACQKSYPFHETHSCSGGDVPAPAPDDADAMVGALLGDRFEIEAFLQSGGMGVVYRARHRILGKPVAVKLLRETQDPMAQQRFLLEAQSACTIGHPNIVDITDYGILEDGRPYLVMEYLIGQPLDQILLGGPLEPARACRIARQVALGLQAVHDKGIVHRDLKPGNVFILDRDGEEFAKILDFGIAKVMAGERQTLLGAGEAAPARMTQAGMVVGTPEYLSPEQAAGEPVDHRTDQYSLGCILYEMLTGEIPFSSDTVGALLRKHVTAPPAPPRQRRPGLAITDELEALVLRTLAKQGDDRFPSMRELAAALQGEAERPGGGGASGGGVPARASMAGPAAGAGGALARASTEHDLPAGRPGGPPRWLLALLGAVALGLLGALLHGLLLRPPGGRAPAAAAPPAAAVPAVPAAAPSPPAPAPRPSSDPAPAARGPARAAPSRPVPERRIRKWLRGPRGKGGKGVIRFKD